MKFRGQNVKLVLHWSKCTSCGAFRKEVSVPENATHLIASPVLQKGICCRPEIIFMQGNRVIDRFATETPCEKLSVVTRSGKGQIEEIDLYQLLITGD